MEDPVRYFQVCASLVPKEVLVEGSELFSEWSDDELAEAIAYVQAALKNVKRAGDDQAQVFPSAGFAGLSRRLG